MNCIRVKIYPSHTVYRRRIWKSIKIHPDLLWIYQYLGKIFYIKTYHDKDLAREDFNHYFIRISFYPDKYEKLRSGSALKVS